MPEPPKPTAEATTKPTVTTEPTKVPSTPTTEPTKTATATPEVKKDASCDLLPQKYCGQAEFVIQQTPTGKTAKMIGIKVPSGEPLTMPITGQIAPTELDSNVVFYKGYQALIFDPNNPTRRYILSGDFKPNSMLSLNMKKGEVFGQTQNTGKEMLGYNLVFYVTDIGPDRQGVTNEEEMRRIFPAAFTKPPIQAAALEGNQSKGGSIYVNTFYSNPPK